MPIRVLVVDDSKFFRRRITEIINSDKTFEVVGQASNGQEAIELARKLQPDLVTMDYEMPYLDGISAVKAILQAKQTSILMFSSLTYDGAKTTLDALEAGASDFLPKSFESVSTDTGPGGSNELLDRLRALAKCSDHSSRMSPRAPARAPAPKPAVSVADASVQKEVGESKPIAPKKQDHYPRTRPKGSIRPRVCVIGSSTGGPMALQSVLKALPANTQFPILIAQHMPAAFTQAFADRLNIMCNVQVCHARNGDRLKPGIVYISPGGMQTIIKDKSLTLSVLKGDERLNYKPCVDLTFASAAKLFPGSVLGIVLTGMGADGADGCRLLKQSNSEIWIQDEESCVVFGMPQAVMKKGYYDEIMSIDRVGPRLSEVATRGST